MNSLQKNGDRGHTRARLTEAALKVMSERGIRATSVADITIAAGLAHGTFYTYFNDKHEIVADVCQAVTAAVHDKIRPIRISLNDATARVAFGVYQFIEIAAAEPRWGRLLTHAIIEFREIREFICRYLRLDVALGVKQGHFAKPLNEFLIDCHLAILREGIKARLAGAYHDVASRAAEYQLRILKVESSEEQSLDTIIHGQLSRFIQASSKEIQNHSATSNRTVRIPSRLPNPEPSKLLRRRGKIADEIMESLRQDIVTRRLPHGQRLPSEKVLSDRFGVSQPTVREAVRALETLGLIEVLHGNGSFVQSHGEYALALAIQTLVQLESVSIAEILAIRQVLGHLSIRQAIANATAEDVEAIESACNKFDQIKDIKDVEEVISRAAGFLRTVSFASHNPLLQALEGFLMVLLTEVQIDSLATKGIRFWRSRALQFQPYRLAVLQGLRSSDPTKASTAMNAYMEKQRILLERDDSVCAFNLSNPKLISAVANVMRQF